MPIVRSDISRQEVITPVQELPVPEETPASETVYVTRTGKKDHRDGYSCLRRSKISISLVEAKQLYSPCGRCNPPR